MVTVDRLNERECTVRYIDTLNQDGLEFDDLVRSLGTCGYQASVRRIPATEQIGRDCGMLALVYIKYLRGLPRMGLLQRTKKLLFEYDAKRL